MPAPLFTILVAAHQTAPYLRKALDSVLAQTCGDFECLAAVEESTDGSLDIAQEYARRDPRFRAVALPKSGSAAASRNYGIDHAAGEYLVFLDGDDWLEPDMLQSCLSSLARFGHVEILQCQLRKVYAQPDGTYAGDQILSELPDSASNQLLDGMQMILKIGVRGLTYGFSVLNICRVDFLRSHRLYQHVGLVLEDFEWVWRCWIQAKSFVFISRPLYVYRRNPQTITMEKSPRFMFDMVREFAFVPSFLREQNPPADVLRVVANKWLAVILGTFFHPQNDHRMTWHDRIEARRELFTPEGYQLLKHFASMGTLPKRIGMRLFLLSRHLGLWVPMLYFRLCYYPLLRMKGEP